MDKKSNTEEHHFRQWFENQNYTIKPLSDVPFEGAGDALFSANKDILWVGYGQRTDELALNDLQYLLSHEITVEGLKLINPDYYHLDTCFCLLNKYTAFYYPGAFTPSAIKKLKNIFQTSLKLMLQTRPFLHATLLFMKIKLSCQPARRK